jgi:hypothetical protein
VSLAIRNHKLIRFYNSEFDQKKDWTPQHISLLCGLATSLSRSIYQLASGSPSPSTIEADCTLVNELLDCATRNFSCSIMFRLYNQTFRTTEPIYSNAFDQLSFSIKTFSSMIYGFMYNVTASTRTGGCSRPLRCEVF